LRIVRIISQQLFSKWGKYLNPSPIERHHATQISRRSIVKSGLIAGAILPVAGSYPRRRGSGPAAAGPERPAAKALGFTNDASKVDTKTYPTFKSSQKCGNCAQYQGKASDATAACTIFAGKSVPQGGWCRFGRKRAEMMGVPTVSRN